MAVRGRGGMPAKGPTKKDICDILIKGGNTMARSALMRLKKEDLEELQRAAELCAAARADAA
eukprot:7577756-Heterocapsa_arctica.AAC.1